MTDETSRGPVHPAVEFLAAPRFAQALTTAGIGLAATVFPVERLIGWAGLISALASLIVLMGLSFIARRANIEWRGLLPITLLGYLAWAGVSLVWSEYRWATLGGLAYLAGFTLIALYIALSRDTIQIVRAFGDVLRFVLLVSLAVEVFSGIIIDRPIATLGIHGNIGTFGPISGLESSRNQLGLVAIVGAVSFATEHRTRSVSRFVSISSLALAALCIVFTFSPVIALATFMVAIAAAIMYGIRRVPPARRQIVQFAVLGLAIIGAIIAWMIRGRLVELFNASGALNYRLNLWQRIVGLLQLQDGFQGWGWVGAWRVDIFPFSALTTAERPTSTALNAFLDVWFQLGIVGLVLFVVLIGFAFTRSWLLAGRRRSVVYAWPAAVLVGLLFVSLAESSILTEFGWMTFVICCLKASQELSWRSALQRPAPPTLPAEQA